MSPAKTKTTGYSIARFDEIDPVDCPCGKSRRAFAVDESAASIHRVQISRDARVHYHKRLTEIYYVLSGSGHLELDGEKVPVGPGMAVQIRPGTRHRAVGRLELLVVATPAFDPADEHSDEHFDENGAEQGSAPERLKKD